MARIELSPVGLQTLLIATRNPGKVVEFEQLLAGGGLACVGLDRFAPLSEVDETGHTFTANASLKASAYAAGARCWAVADDSGLEVDALGGAPGVVSARWAGLHGAADDGGGDGRPVSTDAANNALLLRQLADVPDDQRTARFVCVLALADPAGRLVMTARETFEGSILRQPRGEHGFGYDPLFYVPSMGKSSAELSPGQKHAISHRGRALRRLQAMIDQVRPFDR